MVKMYNPETGEYDIELTLEEAREQYGYGKQTDQEKRDIYDKQVILNPEVGNAPFLLGQPEVGQEYSSLNKGYGKTTTDYDYLEAIGIDTTELRKRGSGVQPTASQIEAARRQQVIAYGDNPAMWNQWGGLTPEGTVQYIADPETQAANAQKIWDRVQILKDEADKRGATQYTQDNDPRLRLMTAGFGGMGLMDESNNQDPGNNPPWDVSGINRNIHQAVIDNLSEDSQRDILDAAYIAHPYAGTQVIPEGMIPSSNYGMNPYYAIEPYVGHTLEFTNPVKLKEAYINALNLGYEKGMIPAGARIGDGTVSAIISEITGMPISTINSLGKAIAGTSASALLFGATKNFPVSAMAYFGVNSLFNTLTKKSQFNGVDLGEARVDGISIPSLKMTLPSGLPNAIFKDYRYICYDRVSLKWYPSDEISPLNYDGGNDYRWLCLDRVTGDTFKCNIVKRPRIFLD